MVNLLIGNSFAWTTLFLALVFVAVATQHAATRSVPYGVRALLKAAPAFFLAAFTWSVDGPPLLTLAFFLCAFGDILLEIARAGRRRAFEVGAGLFAVALVCLSVVYLNKPLTRPPLLLLTIPNIVLAVFVSLWVLPRLRNSLRILGVAYLSILIASNIIASTSLVPVFLGSTLWLMSDLAIGLGRNISGSPANALTNLGLYDLGLYFIAVGLLSL